MLPCSSIASTVPPTVSHAYRVYSLLYDVLRAGKASLSCRSEQVELNPMSLLLVVIWIV